MNLGIYDFQVIFCVLVLIALAAVALIVDYLKGMNQRLRDRHAGLLARHQEMLERNEQDNAQLLSALAEQSKAFRELNLKAIVVSAVESEPPQADATPAPAAPPAPTPKADPPPKIIPIRPKIEPLTQPEPEPNFDTFLENVMDEFSQAEPQAQPEPVTTQPDIEASPLHVPTGVHSRTILANLMEAEEPFTGLALAIGINYFGELEEVFGVEVARELVNTLDVLMSSLVSGGGFLARRADDEFILLFQDLTGAAAHDKLTWISEALWNYQMQTLGTFSVVFAWGAHESIQESLAQALAIAVEKLECNRADRSDADHPAAV
jgi:hypothetical protein